MKTNTRHWLIYTGLFVLAAVALLEGSLRILPFFTGSPLKDHIHEAARITRSNVRTFPESRFGGNTIHLPEISSADVLVVGDSFPFGMYVDEQDTFPMLLGRMLNIRVANLGVSSLSPPQYNRMLEVGMRYAPRVVLYCIFANDFHDYPRDSARKLRLANRRKRFEGDRALFVESLSWSDRFVRYQKRLTNNFLSFQLIKRTLLRPGRRISRIEWQQGDLYFAFAAGYWQNLDWRRDQTKKNLDGLIRVVSAAHTFAAEQNVRFIAVLLPPKEYAYAEAVTRTDPDLAASIFDPFHALTYEMGVRKLEAAGISVIDVTPDLQQAALSGKKLYFSIDGHFNETGHYETARSLARHLRRLQMY